MISFKVQKAGSFLVSERIVMLGYNVIYMSKKQRNSMMVPA